MNLVTGGKVYSMPFERKLPPALCVRIPRESISEHSKNECSSHCEALWNSMASTVKEVPARLSIEVGLCTMLWQMRDRRTKRNVDSESHRNYGPLTWKLEWSYSEGDYSSG
jgi:hypothetical protein